MCVHRGMKTHFITAIVLLRYVQSNHKKTARRTGASPPVRQILDKYYRRDWCEQWFIRRAWPRKLTSARSEGSITLLKTLRHGSNAGLWNAMPTIFKGLSTSLPPTTTPPALGRRKPLINLSIVDFPQPDGPTKATNSPGWIVKFTCCRASSPS